MRLTNLVQTPTVDHAKYQLFDVVPWYYARVRGKNKGAPCPDLLKQPQPPEDVEDVELAEVGTEPGPSPESGPSDGEDLHPKASSTDRSKSDISLTHV